MAKMKKSIIELLSKKIKLDKKEVSNLIKEPDDLKNGDYSFPCYTLKKKYNKEFELISEEIANKIKGCLPFGFEKLEVKGAYINFFLNRPLYAVYVFNKCGDYIEGYFVKKGDGKCPICQNIRTKELFSSDEFDKILKTKKKSISGKEVNKSLATFIYNICNICINDNEMMPIEIELNKRFIKWKKTNLP